MGTLKEDKKMPFATDQTLKTLHKNLEFTASEQYRLLRTNIKFTLPEVEGCITLGVTSSVRGEGKSTTSVNLSYVLAQDGHKTLLIDGDLRIPSVAKKMGIDSKPGLTDLLMGKQFDLERLKNAECGDWYIMPSGDIPPNPSELLGSKRMESVLNNLKEYFDYIVIDLPPVNIVSDAMSVSHFIDGLVVVIREEYASKKDVDRCFKQLQLSNVNVLGCVMNNSQSSGGAYGNSKYGKYKNYKYHRYYKDYKYKSYEMDPDEEESDNKKSKTKESKVNKK